VDTAGQITAVVVSETKRSKQSSISRDLMNSNSKIEQVVFVEENRIQTMGNELCINGSLAGAYLSNSSVIEISGLNKPIKFVKQKGFVSADFPLNILQKKAENIIQLTGIVYKISNNTRFTDKTYLNKLANEYNVPASGIIISNKNKITPEVYVKDTDTLVWENACGSGSLAYSIFSEVDKIRQPSGEIIEIKKTEKYFTIKVPIKIVK
jgi:diaminopimelate epimerase